MKQKSLFVIECITPGLSCCQYRLVATGCSAENVVRSPVWCAKWRLQRDKETVIYGCNPDFPEWFKKNGLGKAK